MDEKRPGGLTALAVINFVLTAFSMLAVAGSIFLYLVLMDKINVPAETKEEMIKALGDDNDRNKLAGLVLFGIFISVISALLLLISGIGYLRLKKVSGRWMGTAYGLFSIAITVVSFFTMPASLGGSFSFSTIIGLIYPILTLVLVNVVFKEDLVK